MDITAKRIAELRELHNLNKTEFGHKIGVNRTTVTRYEIGELKPNLDIMINIHHAFGVSLDWIAGVEDINNEILQYGYVISECIEYGISPEKLQLAVNLMKG